MLYKLFAWGGGDIGGHVLRETTSRGLCGLVCPSRTSDRGGEGDCVKEGGGGEGKCERERALELVPLVWVSNPKLQGGWCKPNHQPIGGPDPNHQEPTQGCHERCVRVCLLLKELVQSCLLGEGGILEDMCYERLRAEASVN